MTMTKWQPPRRPLLQRPPHHIFKPIQKSSRRIVFADVIAVIAVLVLLEVIYFILNSLVMK
jgi:hypothetical protein